jgi:hypothetical protein
VARLGDAVARHRRAKPACWRVCEWRRIHSVGCRLSDDVVRWLVGYLPFCRITLHVEQLDAGNRLQRLVIGKRPNHLFVGRHFDEMW